MRISQRWMVVVPMVAGLQLAACSGKTAAPGHIKPATVEHIEGQEVSRITLTPKAAERLDIKTVAVPDPQLTRSGARRPVVPYAAVLYDAKGVTWVYTSPANLVYVRHPITVDYIEGDQAVLTDGPPAGTQVVTQGGQELFGAEFEIGH
ncbi:MAG: hypothetical protein ACREJ4_02205 [Candidatus Methylomirabilaceae bacterium]